jgi:hypothetical protein
MVESHCKVEVRGSERCIQSAGFPEGFCCSLVVKLFKERYAMVIRTIGILTPVGFGLLCTA